MKLFFFLQKFEILLYRLHQLLIRDSRYKKFFSFNHYIADCKYHNSSCIYAQFVTVLRMFFGHIFQEKDVCERKKVQQLQIVVYRSQIFSLYRPRKQKTKRNWFYFFDITAHSNLVVWFWGISRQLSQCCCH